MHRILYLLLLGLATSSVSGQMTPAPSRSDTIRWAEPPPAVSYGQFPTLTQQYERAYSYAGSLFPEDPPGAARWARHEIEKNGAFYGKNTLAEQYLEALQLAQRKIYSLEPHQEELARIWAVEFFEQQGAFRGDKTLDEQYHEAYILAYNRFFNNYPDRQARSRSWARIYLEKKGRFSPEKGARERYQEAFNLAFHYLFTTAAAREYQARQWADQFTGSRRDH